jgi:hypothetical protein
LLLAFEAELGGGVEEAAEVFFHVFGAAVFGEQVLLFEVVEVLLQALGELELDAVEELDAVLAFEGLAVEEFVDLVEAFDDQAGEGFEDVFGLGVGVLEERFLVERLGSSLLNRLCLLSNPVLQLYYVLFSLNVQQTILIILKNIKPLRNILHHRPTRILLHLQLQYLLPRRPRQITLHLVEQPLHRHQRRTIKTLKIPLLLLLLLQIFFFLPQRAPLRLQLFFLFPHPSIFLLSFSLII